MNNQLSKRKPTRIKGYDYSTQGAYFVTICVKDNKSILSDIIKPVGDGAFDVPKIQLTAIGKTVEKYLLSSENISGVKIDCYVIMPDHIHAIIIIEKGTSKAPSPTNQTLPHVISTFKRFCNKQVGHSFFQRGYYDHIIRDEEDYITRKNYMEQNPIRWYYNKK